MSDHKNIQEAMLAFSAEFTGAHKTGVNPHFNSQHFTLDDVVRATELILQKHGMYACHSMRDGLVTTAIVHALSNTSIESSISMPAIQDPQKIGSAITYYKRYNLCALLNIAEADDDGNTAAAPDLATKEQLAQIQEYRESDSISENMEKWLKKQGSNLTAQNAEQAIINIKKRLGQ